MAEDHMNYMHNSFPAPQGHDHGDHLSRHHELSTHDSMLRGRTEPHSVPGGGAGGFASGHDSGAKESVGKGTV